MISALVQKFKKFYVHYVKHQSDTVKILRHHGAKIGENTHVYSAPSSFGSEPWLVEVGDWVTIAPECILITHDASSRLFRKQFPDEMSEFGDNFQPIIIKNNCFIGAGVIIMPGVVLEEYTIVGAGSIVTKSFPGHSVIAGVPAKLITSYEDYIEKYRKKFDKVQATNRTELRKELTMKYFGEYR